MLWNGQLAWMLGEEVLEYNVECSAGDAKEIAAQGLEVRYDGAAFAPMLLLLEVDNAVWDRVGMGANSSGDCQVARAPVKYWRGQKMRNCCSSWSAWWRTT